MFRCFTPAVYWLFFSVFLFSCGPKGEDMEVNRTLLESIAILQKNNANMYNHFEHMVREGGNRNEDTQLLEKLDQILALRKEYKFDPSEEFSLAYMDEWERETYSWDQQWMDFPDERQLENTLNKFSEALIKAYRETADDELSRDPELSDLVKKAADRFISQKSIENLGLLELSILELENHILEYFSRQVGAHDIICFIGQAYVYPQTIEAEVNKPFNFIISMNSHEIEESLLFKDSRVWINEELQPDSSLVAYEKGVWFFTYHPKSPGKYKLAFDVVIQSDLYESPVPYHYVAEEEFEVQ